MFLVFVHFLLTEASVKDVVALNSTLGTLLLFFSSPLLSWWFSWLGGVSGGSRGYHGGCREHWPGVTQGMPRWTPRWVPSEVWNLWGKGSRCREHVCVCLVHECVCVACVRVRLYVSIPEFNLPQATVCTGG